MSESLPIVLVPGLGNSPRNHLNILPALWRHGALTIANQTRDDSVAAMAARVLADAPPRFALIGHSLGGYIVLEMMRQAPERIARLALMSTQARTDPPEVTERRKAQIELAKNGNYEEVLDRLWPLLVHASRVDDIELREQVYDARNEAGPEVFVRQQTAIMNRPDARPNLPKIRVPTLVLTGDDDRLISNEQSREMADLIPGAKLVVVPMCGHMPSMEQPEAVIEALDEWLAG